MGRKKEREYLKVLIVEPGILPYEKEIENDLHAMQEIVGGLIEPIYPYQDRVALVCNEEGIIRGLPFNRSVEGGYEGVFGTFFICGFDNEDLCSLTDEQVKTYREKFKDAEILIGVKGNDLFTLKVTAQQKESQSQPPKTPEHDSR